MMSKIIFFDIDNTIIDHYKGEIPKSTILALQKLKANNHRIVIASGKGPNFIKSFIPEIDFTTFIALNGNYVVYENKVIYEEYLPENLVKSFHDYCLVNKIPFVLSNLINTSTLYQNNQAIKDYYTNFSLPYPNTITKVEDFAHYLQMSVMLEEREEIELINKFPEFNFVRMSKYGMNVLFNNGLKEKGIKKLLTYTNWPKEDTYAFGDGLNDIGMFKLVNTSVAMGNAYSELKKQATMITNHISNDGIYNACQKLKLF